MVTAQDRPHKLRLGPGSSTENITMLNSAKVTTPACNRSQVPVHRSPVPVRRHFLGLTILLCLFTLMPCPDISVAAPRSRVDASYDVVIQNGKIVDGSGNPWFYAD